MTKKPRIRKPPARRIKELRQFTSNLDKAIVRFEKGEQEAMSDMLTNLRTLIGQREGRNKGIIHSLADQYTLVGHVHNEKGEKITFDDFLQQVQLTIEGERISNADFVWKYGSQVAAHSDEGIDLVFLEAESFHVGGMSIVHRIVYGISKTTQTVAGHLAQVLEKDGERLMHQLKSIGKWN
jgi:hypothetical protein